MSRDFDEVKNLSRLVENIANSSRNKKKYIERQKEKNKVETQLTRPIASNQLPYDNMDDYLLNLRSDSLMASGRNAKRHRDVQKKALMEMLNRSQFSSERFQKIYKDKSSTLRPLIRFFKQMIPRRSGYREQSNFITKSKLRLHIPYTVIYGLDSYPIMYYTDEQGFVTRVDNPSSRNIAKKMDITEGPKDDKTEDKSTTNDTNKFNVVMKREFPGEVVTNMATPMTSKQLQTLLEQPNTSLTLFQRFVPTKGSKATVARVAWRADSPSYGFMLSNKVCRSSIFLILMECAHARSRHIVQKTPAEETEKDRIKQLLVDTDNLDNLQIFKMSGKSMQELSSIAHHLAKFVEQKSRQRMRFNEFVCDFIRDEASQWWFTQVKAFVFEAYNASISKPITSSYIRENKASYMKMKECKMCLNLFESHELGYSMSLKMIFATETQLKRRATKLAWFDRPEYNSISDTSLWYTFHKVCKSCFDMYLQEQKLAKVEVEFARAIGIPVNKTVHERASILSTMNSRLRSGTGSQDSMDTTAAIKRLRCRGLRMYRIILYLNEVRKLPVSLKDGFTLRLHVFNTEVVVPLQPRFEAHMDVLPVGKLRVFYFFATDENAFRKWVHEVGELSVAVCRGNEEIAIARLPLTQFASGLIDKLDYMTLFSGSAMQLCALRATLGFVKMSDMDLSNVHLEEYDDNIFLPEEDFFTADPLPNEWMEVIPRLATELPLDEVNRTMDRIGSRTSRPNSPSFMRRPQSAMIRRRPVSGSFRPSSARSYLSSPGALTTRPMSASNGMLLGSSSASPQKQSSSSSLNGTSGGLTSRTLQIRAASAGRSRPSRSLSQSKLSARRRARSRTRNLPSSTHAKSKNDNVWQAPDFSHDMSSTRKMSLVSRHSDLGARQSKTDTEELHPEIGEEKWNPEDDSNLQPLSAQFNNADLPYGVDDSLFRINARLGTVSNLNSPVDKSWVLSFTMLRKVKFRYETFQLISGADLDFGSRNEEIYLSTTPKQLQNYFNRERYIVVVLHPKWEPGNIWAAQLDMSKLEQPKSSDRPPKYHRGASKFEHSVQVDQWFVLESKTEAEMEEMLNDLEGADEEEIMDDGDDAMASMEGSINDDNGDKPRIKFNITCAKMRSTAEDLESRGIRASDVQVLAHLEDHGVRAIHHPDLGREDLTS